MSSLLHNFPDHLSQKFAYKTFKSSMFRSLDTTLAIPSLEQNQQFAPTI